MITLTKEDFATIVNLLKEVPFQHAYPIFQFLANKVKSFTPTTNE